MLCSTDTLQPKEEGVQGLGLSMLHVTRLPEAKLANASRLRDTNILMRLYCGCVRFVKEVEQLQNTNLSLLSLSHTHTYTYKHMHHTYTHMNVHSCDGDLGYDAFVRHEVMLCGIFFEYAAQFIPHFMVLFVRRYCTTVLR